jgi:hypothetical protein
VTVPEDIQTLRDARVWLDSLAEGWSHPLHDGACHAFAVALRAELQRLQGSEKAANEWAKVMEHERDFEQQVVTVDLQNRLDDAEARLVAGWSESGPRRNPADGERVVTCVYCGREEVPLNDAEMWHYVRTGKGMCTGCPHYVERHRTGRSPECRWR